MNEILLEIVASCLLIKEKAKSKKRKEEFLTILSNLRAVTFSLSSCKEPGV
jgi:hypothetical protein